MNEEASTARDERAIETLVRSFAVKNDAGDYEALADMFMEEASFARPSAPDQPVVGKAAILASFRARPQRMARHLVCNTIVKWVGDNQAEVHSYLVLIASGGEGKASLSVGAFDDIVVRENGAWLFKSRRGSMAIDAIPIGS